MNPSLAQKWSLKPATRNVLPRAFTKVSTKLDAFFWRKSEINRPPPPTHAHKKKESCCNSWWFSSLENLTKIALGLPLSEWHFFPEADGNRKHGHFWNPFRIQIIQIRIPLMIVINYILPVEGMIEELKSWTKPTFLSPYIFFNSLVKVRHLNIEGIDVDTTIKIPSSLVSWIFSWFQKRWCLCVAYKWTFYDCNLILSKFNRYTKYTDYLITANFKEIINNKNNNECSFIIRVYMSVAYIHNRYLYSLVPKLEALPAPFPLRHRYSPEKLTRNTYSSMRCTSHCNLSPNNLP